MALAIAGRTWARSNRVLARGDKRNLRSALGLVSHGPVLVNRTDTGNIGKAARIVDLVPRLCLIPCSGKDQNALRPRVREDLIQLGDISWQSGHLVDPLGNTYNLGTLADRVVDRLANLVEEVSGDHRSDRAVIDLQREDPGPGRQSVGPLPSVGLPSSCDEPDHLGAVSITIGPHAARAATKVLARQELPHQIRVVQLEPAVDDGDRDALSFGHLPHLRCMHGVQMPLVSADRSICSGRHHRSPHHAHTHDHDRHEPPSPHPAAPHPIPPPHKNA